MDWCGNVTVSLKTSGFALAAAAWMRELNSRATQIVKNGILPD
jgi:hypothetical protein